MDETPIKESQSRPGPGRVSSPRGYQRRSSPRQAPVLVIVPLESAIGGYFSYRAFDSGVINGK